MENFKINQLQLIGEKENSLVYELPTSEINLIDHEQLDELMKPAHLFFNCKKYIVHDRSVQFFYEKEAGFEKIELYRNNKKLMKTAALNLFEIENLIGTQYTTILHPKNIFIKADGTVKLAHRGIRNVFPNQTLNTAKLVTDMRKLFIYLFSDIPFELIEENTYNPPLDEPLLIRLRQSKTLVELREALEEHSFEQVTKPTVKKKEKVKEPHKKQEQTETKKKKGLEGLLSQLSPLVVILIGFVIGMGLIYLAQVLPLKNATADEFAAAEKEAEDEIAALETEKSALEEQVTLYENRVDAYQFVIQDEMDQAVQQFEALEQLDELEEQYLFDLYLEQGTFESISKGLDLDPQYELRAIRALIALETEEATEFVLNWETNLNEVRIEQAYLDENYQLVVELAPEVEGYNRGQRLAAYSYIEMDQPEEALEIGQALDHNAIQISSLRKEIELLQDDNDLDDDEKEEREEELQDEIDDLRGNN